MRAYYSIATEILPGWTLPARRSFKIKRGATKRLFHLGKTDLITFWSGGVAPKLKQWSDVSVRAKPEAAAPHVRMANLSYDARAHAERERQTREDAGLLTRYLAARDPASRSRAAEAWDARLRSPDPTRSGGATAEEILSFIRTYGTLLADRSGIASEPSEVSVAAFRDIQETLRDAWRRGAKLLWFPKGFEQFDTFDIPITWQDGALALRPADLWTYIRLLLTSDLAVGRARICANDAIAECATPFFVATRTDQRYCSHKCAVDENNRRGKNRRRHGK